MAKEPQKYLRKMGSGKIFGFTEELAGRGDMIPCDKKGTRTDIELSKNDVLRETTEMEIMGNKHDVPDYLIKTVEELIASKTPDNVKVVTVGMVLNGNEHQVPNSMVMDVKALIKTMDEATEGTADLQAQISEAIKVNGELEKDRARIKEDRAVARREATNLKKKLDKLEAD